MLSRHLAAGILLFPTRIHLFFVSSFPSDILTSLVSLILSPRRRPVRPARLTYVPIDHIVRSPLFGSRFHVHLALCLPLKFQSSIIRFYCSRGPAWKQKMEGMKVSRDVRGKEEENVVKLSSSLRVTRTGRKARTMSMTANTLTVLKIRPLDRDWIHLAIKFSRYIKGDREREEQIVISGMRSLIYQTHTYIHTQRCDLIYWK